MSRISATSTGVAKGATTKRESPRERDEDARRQKERATSLSTGFSFSCPDPYFIFPEDCALLAAAPMRYDDKTRFPRETKAIVLLAERGVPLSTLFCSDTLPARMNVHGLLQHVHKQAKDIIIKFALSGRRIA